MIKDPFARLGLDREVLTVSQLNGRARVSVSYTHLTLPTIYSV